MLPKIASRLETVGSQSYHYEKYIKNWLAAEAQIRSTL